MPIEQSQLLQQPVDIVRGELIFCLRQANPGQSICGCYVPANNSFEYHLWNNEDRFIDFGDAGIINIWPTGNQTYLAQTNPPKPCARESLADMLAGWFRFRECWPDQRKRLTPAGLRLVRKLMDQIEEYKGDEIVFESPVSLDVLKDFCIAIQAILSAALRCEMGDAVDQAGGIPLIEQAVYDWARSRYPPSDPPDAGLLIGVKKLWNRLWVDDAESPDAVTKLTFEEQAVYQFDEIKALLDQCVQRVSEKRMAFQKDIVSALKDRLGRHPQNALSMPIEIADDAKSGSIGMPVGEKDQNTALQSEQEKFQAEVERAFEMKYWELIDDVGNNREILRMCWNGNMDKEIADELGLIPGSISNVLSIIREDYGDYFTPSSRNRLRAWLKKRGVAGNDEK